MPADADAVRDGRQRDAVPARGDEVPADANPVRQQRHAGPAGRERGSADGYALPGDSVADAVSGVGYDVSSDADEVCLGDGRGHADAMPGGDDAMPADGDTVPGDADTDAMPVRSDQVPGDPDDLPERERRGG